MRTMVLELRKTPTLLFSSPWVQVDGHRMMARWGSIQLPVPADRPCLIEAYLPYIGGFVGTANAGFWLYPQNPPYLEYSAPYQKFFAGEMGPPGTTHHHCKTAVIAMGIGIGAILLLILVLMVLKLSL